MAIDINKPPSLRDLVLLTTSNPLSAALSLAVLTFGFFLIRIIYRLTFHPLARFPGPKLAAATSMYRASYDVPKNSSFVKILPALHDKYGPIVRTSPNQLHIRDLESYHQIYRGGSKFDKDGTFYDTIAIVEHSFLGILSRSQVKARKDMYQPYFSKAAIQRLESTLHMNTQKFLSVLSVAAKEKKEVDLSLGFTCLTADAVMYYSYQKSFGALDAPDFQFRPIKELEEMFDIVPIFWNFPKLMKSIFVFTTMLPDFITEKYFPAVAATKWIQNQCRDRIIELKSREKSDLGSQQATIFDTALNPDTSKGQYALTARELQADAVLMFVAGTDTTANTLVNATWGLLNNPQMLSKLKSELRTAIPDKTTMLNWSALEALPYLRSVVKESLRVGFGVPGRIPRIVPKSGAVFCNQVIPPGTSVCHSTYCYHTDDKLFANAAAFNPDRWLGNSEEFQDLDNKLLSFSKGSRGCLGMNLAYAEIFLTLAHLFRRFDLSIHSTTPAMMGWDDCFTPKTKGHLKVLITEAKD